MISGFIVIDKPAGITSHDVVSRVRRILGIRKVGHTGTLDPFATGVLPVAVNDGTKVIPFLDEGVKRYQARMKLGIVTDTLDVTGRIVRQSDSSGTSKDALETAMNAFVGSISQVPPMYSAIKRDGQPLYKLARQGQEIEREPRQVLIHTLELLSFSSPWADFAVTCSRGTYVRSLADDIGSRLGCGATLEGLRRTASGPFDISASVTLEQLEQAVGDGAVEALVVTPHDALNQLADIELKESGFAKLKFGKAPQWEDTTSGCPSALCEGDLVRLSCNGSLVAVGQINISVDGGRHVTLKRVLVAV